MFERLVITDTTREFNVELLTDRFDDLLDGGTVVTTIKRCV